MAVWCQVWRGQVNARFAICHLPLPAPPTGGAVKITSKLSSFTVSRQARASQPALCQQSLDLRDGPLRCAARKSERLTCGSNCAHREGHLGANCACAGASQSVGLAPARSRSANTAAPGSSSSSAASSADRPAGWQAGRLADSRTDWLAGRPIGSLEGISAPRQRRAASAAAPASRAPWERLPRPCLCRCVCAHISSCRRRRSRRVSRRAKRERRQLNSTPPSS